jgi:hypothetical protein
MHGGLARALCFAPLVVLGCGPSPGPRATGIDALVSGLADAACGWQQRCCSPIEREDPSVSSSTECAPRATAELERAAARLRASLAAGTVTFDVSAAEDCLAKARAQSCGVPGMSAKGNDLLGFERWFQACLNVFHGRIAVGERCAHRAECVAGARCAFVGQDAGAQDTLDADPLSPVSGSDSVCVAYRERGEACQVDDDCNGPLGDYCNVLDHHCAALGAVGDACGFVRGDNAPAGFNDVEAPRCGPGTYCPGADSACRPLPRDGEPCATGNVCDPDPALQLTCLGGGPGDLFCTTAAQEGDACGTSALPPCARGLACRDPGERGLGACRPPAMPGEPCGRNGTCASPGRCLLGPQTCAMPGPLTLGQTCADDRDCASLFCEAVPDSNGVVSRSCAPVRFVNIECSGAEINRGGVGNISKNDPFDAGFGAFDGPVLPPPFQEPGDQDGGESDLDGSAPD